MTFQNTGLRNNVVLGLCAVVLFALASCSEDNQATNPSSTQNQGKLVLYKGQGKFDFNADSIYTYDLQTKQMTFHPEPSKLAEQGFLYSFHRSGSFLGADMLSFDTTQLVYFKDAAAVPTRIPTAYNGRMVDALTATISNDGRSIYVQLYTDRRANTRSVGVISLADLSIRVIAESVIPGIVYPRPGTDQFAVIVDDFIPGENRKLVLYSSTGQVLRETSELDAETDRPATAVGGWSPDGRFLMGTVDGQLATFSAETGQVQTSGGSELYPLFPGAWEPSGSSAYVTRVISNLPDPFTARIEKINAASRSFTNVANLGGPFSFITSVDPDNRYAGVFEYSLEDTRGGDPNMEDTDALILDLRSGRVVDTLRGVLPASLY